jgi:release factor glutamine methyltransferase
MKRTIDHIRKSLAPIYPVSEVDSFIKIIFKHLFNFSLTDIILKNEELLTNKEYVEVDLIVQRLKKGEPIQYILGMTTFYDLSFEVNPSVLIPRNETEELVDHILKKHSLKKMKILDIGTGSGAIAIAIQKNMPLSEVYACDISQSALETAQKNAQANQVEVRFFQHDILSDKIFPFDDFDLIVSNPPYITEKEKTLMEANVLEHEPHLALFVPNNDPLLFYRTISEKALRLLKGRGELWFEINEAYGDDVARLLESQGFDASLLKDINGKDRMAYGIIKTR